MSSQIRLRFAPSPTGHLHVGGARTALFNFYRAKSMGGAFVLRIEDTDRARSTKEYEEGILKGLQWLGIQWDEGPFYQSERTELYLKAVQQLLDSGHAYKCYCSNEEIQKMREEAQARKEKPRYNRKCRDLKDSAELEGRSYTVRFKAPLEGSLSFEDEVLGTIKIDHSEGDDFILLRSDGAPTYQLTVVVDDHDLKISHVFRGDDHLNNTPKQILLFQALGWPVPAYAHVPMILGPDKAKLSKRHGAVAVFSYKDEGYLPQAFRNSLVRLGWSSGDQELFSDEELKCSFHVKGCGKSPSVFDTQKLKWMNQQWIQKMSAEEFISFIEESTSLKIHSFFKSESEKKLLKLFQERCELSSDFEEAAAFFIGDDYPRDEKAFEKVFKKCEDTWINSFQKKIEDLSSIHSEDFFPLLKETAQELEVGVGSLAKAIRLLLTGTLKSPDLGVLAEALGKEKVLARLQKR